MSEQTTTPTAGWTTYAPRPRLGLLVLPGAFCIVMFAAVLLVELRALPSGAWLLAFSMALTLASLISAVLLARQMLRERISVQVTDEGFRARQGGADPVAIAWRDVRRVQSGDHALVFEVSDHGTPRQLIVQAPAPQFPSEDLCRAIGARLDASRGYASSLCDATGEPTDVAIEHGGCNNPLGCASSGSCAVQALQQGATSPAAATAPGAAGTNPA